MALQFRRWIWIALLLCSLAVVALAAVITYVGLDKADQLASVISALTGLVALGVAIRSIAPARQAEAPPPESGDRRIKIAIAFVAATLAGAIAAGTLVFLTIQQAVSLIPVDTMQEDAFVSEPADPHTPGRDVRPAFIDGAPEAGGNVDGSRDGAYATTKHGVACDVGKLVKYLTDPRHAAQARTWAATHRIQPGQIRSYLARLTPVRLRMDARVTNYDYKDGEATPYQAVLQAGTAVLVDERGVPRVKCNCGNPLAEPRGTASTSDNVRKYAHNPGDAWSSFAPRRVATFTAGKKVKRFTLIDLDDGKLYQRKVGFTGKKDTPLRSGDSACADLRQSTSCGGPGPRVTPEDEAALEATLRRITGAVENGDCTPLYDALTSASTRKLGMSRAAFIAKCQAGEDQLRSLGARTTIDDVKVVEQRGAQAIVAFSGTVTISGGAGGPQSQRFSGERRRLIRENGNWKIELPDQLVDALKRAFGS
ncbi:DUF6777 domain-containing protein [Nonomuraea typhae]|uniref:DUF6777 domain-containing protein n=1 Tax=Nonomuraea typhae TaxID=2603600 RepID=UPI0012FC3AF9|nr:DUF6777 domain-containing protein [Nonomuraea typhae]